MTKLRLTDEQIAQMREELKRLSVEELNAEYNKNFNLIIDLRKRMLRTENVFEDDPEAWDLYLNALDREEEISALLKNN